MFKENVTFHAPPGFSDALLKVARRHHMTKSEYLRRCALERMEMEGVKVPVRMLPDASAFEPEQRAGETR